MLIAMFLIKQIFEKKKSKTASKIQMQFCPRIITEQSEGSYKLGSLYPFLCLSICPSVHLSGHVLGNTSLVLSKFWHGFKVWVNKTCTYYISEYHFWSRFSQFRYQTKGIVEYFKMVYKNPRFLITLQINLVFNFLQRNHEVSIFPWEKTQSYPTQRYICFSSIFIQIEFKAQTLRVGRDISKDCATTQIWIWIEEKKYTIVSHEDWALSHAKCRFHGHVY